MMMFYLDWLKVSRLCDKSRILTGAARGYRLNHQSNILFTGNSTALIKNCTVSVTKQGNQILSSPGLVVEFPQVYSRHFVSLLMNLPFPPL